MIKQKAHRFPFFSLDEFFRKHSNWYIALFLLFSFIRIVWSIDRGLNYSLHDPYFYLLCAKHISCGDWLGPLEVYTLTKSCLFPLFISLSLISGIPYLLLMDLCWCLAALLGVKALSPILKRPACLLLYVALIFRPMVNTHQILTIQELYLMLIFCSLVSFAGLWIRYNRDKGFSYPWLAAGGLFFSLTIHTREEGAAWIIIPLTYALLIVLRSFWKDKLPVKKLILRLLCAAAVMIITYEAVDQPIRIINYRYYKFYGCNIRHTHAWKQFTGTLLGIAKELDPEWDIRIPVRYDILDRIYELSPNFAKLKVYLRRDNFFAFYPAQRFPKEELKRCPNLVNNIKGGFLQWELLGAMKAIRLLKNNDWRDMETFLYAVVDDFRKAAEAGKIKNFKVRNSNLPPYDSQMPDWFIRKTGWTVKRVFWDPTPVLRPIYMYNREMKGIQLYEIELYDCLKCRNALMHPYYLAIGWGFQPKAGAAPLKRESFSPAGSVLSFQINPRPDVQKGFSKSFPKITDQVGFKMVLTNPRLTVKDDNGRVIYKGDITKKNNGFYVHFDIVKQFKELPSAKLKREWSISHCLWITKNIKWMFLASIAMAVFLLFQTCRTGFLSPYSKLLVSGMSLWFAGALMFFIVIFANVLLHCHRLTLYLYSAVLMLYFSYSILLIGGGSLLIRQWLALRLKRKCRRLKA